ncbi:likely ferric reductase [Pseudozyma hubeiensis SY62]|uniref:Likely ferric reductase n=1 Tax=Pseudozyma hubeiensis (strain SY62) TaxID=1305764 RepID=R9P767_PSEHS|nr:likely ferric reductase [Pseudozyma hubeiensis SY62]GAC93925.1 likely ferric reductase [Pseudozyma hubeiensis SY62]
MIAPPWTLDAYAWEQIAKLPDDQKEYGWATFRHYYYNSYKVPCVATFLIWSLFLFLALASGFSSLLAVLLPRAHHALSRRTSWWRGHISEHPLASEKHSQVIRCGSGCLRWLTLHVPLRLETAVLIVMMILNVVPYFSFYSLYVGHNTYFVGTDSVSRRSQILRHLANRCAMLGIGQLPMLILLASKRTPVALLSQLSMNTLMLFHRWIARMCYLHIIVHVLCNALIFHFGIGARESLKHPPVQLGILAVTMLSGLVFLSLRALRKRHYEVFVFLHISMAVLMLIFTYLHIKLLHQGRLALQIFVIELSAALWAFDRLVRLLGRVAMSLSWRYADGAGATRKAELKSYGDGAYTRLRIQVPASRLRLVSTPSESRSDSSMELGKGPRQWFGLSHSRLRFHPGSGIVRIGAGDDIRITIPRLQWFSDHPFSVFAVGRRKSDGPNMGYVDLIIQRQAGLTQKLAVLAQELSSSKADGLRIPNDDFLKQAVQNKGRRVRVVIDGPFGRSPSLEGARHAVLVAGGIAITFCYPLLVKAALGRFTGLETCKLVWIIRDEGILDALRDGLSELLRELELQGSASCRLSIDIYTTSKARTVPSGLSHDLRQMPDGQLPASPEPTQQEPIQQESIMSSTFQLMSSIPLPRHTGSSISVPSPSHSASKLSPGMEVGEPCHLLVLPRFGPIYQQVHMEYCTAEERALQFKGGLPTSLTFDNKYSPSASSQDFSEAAAEPSTWKSGCTPSRCLESSHSASESVCSTSPSGASSPKRPFETSLTWQDKVHSRLSVSHDILSETPIDALIRIRRFQGRPTSMALVHNHVPMEDMKDNLVFASCGPATMCDAVRSEAVVMLKQGWNVTLVEDCFNW